MPGPVERLELRISIITPLVRDLERSFRFYAEGLGFPTSDPDGHLWEVAGADSWKFNPDGSPIVD